MLRLGQLIEALQLRIACNFGLMQESACRTQQNHSNLFSVNGIGATAPWASPISFRVDTTMGLVCHRQLEIEVCTQPRREMTDQAQQTVLPVYSLGN